jgi:hypothetical protein
MIQNIIAGIVIVSFGGSLLAMHRNDKFPAGLSLTISKDESSIKLSDLAKQIKEGRFLQLGQIDIMQDDSEFKEYVIKLAQNTPIEHDIRRQLRAVPKARLGDEAARVRDFICLWTDNIQGQNIEYSKAMRSLQLLMSKNRSRIPQKPRRYSNQVVNSIAIVAEAALASHDLGLPEDRQQELSKDKVAVDFYLYDILTDQSLKQYICEEQLLFHAAANNNVELLEFFLKRGISPNSSYTISLVNNYPLLYRAAIHKADLSVNCLLEKGADPNTMTSENETPLMAVLSSDALPIQTTIIVAKLLAHGAGRTVNQQNVYGQTAFTIAQRVWPTLAPILKALSGGNGV